MIEQLNKAFVDAGCNKLFVYKAMTFGDWLRKEIKRTGLSNAEIARRSELSPTYIGNLVRDFNPNTKDGKGRPSEETVEAVVKAVEGDLSEARLAAGYSSNRDIRKPKNPAEFFEILDELGLDINLDGGFKTLDNLDEDDLQELLDSVLASAVAKSKRKAKKGE